MPTGNLDEIYHEGDEFERKNWPGYLELQEIVGHGSTREYIFDYYCMPDGRGSGDIRGIYKMKYTALKLQGDKQLIAKKVGVDWKQLENGSM